MSGEPIITVVGNLTGDPELRFTPSGSAVANFTIASTPRTVRLVCSWSGTGWQDRYWPYCPGIVTLHAPDPFGVFPRTCPITGWSAGTRPAHLGSLIRRLSTLRGVTHHSAVPL